VFRTGGLDVGPRDPGEGVAIDLDAYMQSMTAEGVPFETLDSAEIMRRFPAWRLSDEHVGLFQPDAGLADPSRGNAAHRSLAAAQGASLRSNARVVSITDAGGEAVVELEGGERIRAGVVVLATDSWTNELLGPMAAALPLTVTQEQVSWFTPRVDPALFAPERFPVWIWMHEPSFYGFPVHGHPGPKIGQDVGGREVTNATRTYERDEEAHARVMAFLDEHLPGMAVDPFLTKTCLYTLTPDRDFVVDTVPGHSSVHVLLGSAHAYKFASVLGRIIAERIVEGSSPSEPELEAFGFDRPALSDPDAAKAFIV
jgi:sarcosine oxidase